MLRTVTCFTSAALKLQSCDKGNSASKKRMPLWFRANSISRMHPRGSNNFVKIGFSLRRNDQKLHFLTRIRHFSSFWKAKSLEIPKDRWKNGMWILFILRVPFPTRRDVYVHTVPVFQHVSTIFNICYIIPGTGNMAVNKLIYVGVTLDNIILNVMSEPIGSWQKLIINWFGSILKHPWNIDTPVLTKLALKKAAPVK